MIEGIKDPEPYGLRDKINELVEHINILEEKLLSAEETDNKSENSQ